AVYPVRPSFPTRRSSDLRLQLVLAVAGRVGVDVDAEGAGGPAVEHHGQVVDGAVAHVVLGGGGAAELQAVVERADVDHRAEGGRSEEHTSELQSRENLVC